MTRRLYRSGREKMLGGVSGGLADYFEVDVTLIRLVWLLTLMPGGLGFLAYILAWVIIPLNPEHRPDNYQGPREEIAAKVREVREVIETNPEERLQRREKNRQLIGAVLVVIGVLFLFDQLFAWFRWEKLWPLLLIGIGGGILIRAKDGGSRG